jgi:hypothetical protein
VLREVVGTAKLKPVVMPSGNPESGYRPSAALAEFVRLRDLTCRFPGCDKPAEVCDIDHTIPYPLGPTDPSNLKCPPSPTFWATNGWRDEQLPDGIVIWASPTLHGLCIFGRRDCHNGRRRVGVPVDGGAVDDTCPAAT